MAYVSNITACSQRVTPPSAAPGSKDTLSAAPIKPTTSDEIGLLMNGLIADSRLRPDVNALDTYAAAAHWSKNPPEINSLLNAKVGYHGVINGQKVIVGGDGSNDIFALSITEGFDPAKVEAALSQAFELRDEGPVNEAGEMSEAFTLTDRGEQVGMVIVTWGFPDAIRGKGTVAFMSAKKLKEARGSDNDE
ncbi:MAG: hypothetical protein ACLPTM_08375 [Steroidobacteraceae bacterium]